MNPALSRPSAAQLRPLLGAAASGPGAGTGVCLVIDADRTLAPEDSGRLIGQALGLNESIRAIFEEHGYTEPAFARVAEQWSRVPAARYRDEIERVSARITIHAAWTRIVTGLDRAVPIFVVTAGTPQVWRLALARAGFGDLPVIGGCHAALDSYFVCPEVKSDLVAILQCCGWQVVAAGDSLIDLPMLQRADWPLFVPDSKGSPALREQLFSVPNMRHLTIDDRRFDGLLPCSAEEVIELARMGACHHVD